jgi:uncharacterized protein involved in exopolysaccharide biosynthesis
MTADVVTRIAALSAYLSLLARGAKFLLAGAIAGAIMGGVWYAVSPVTYSSTVTVALQRIPTHVPLDPEARSARLVTIDTDAALLHSDEIRSAVAPVIDVQEDDVHDHLTVTASPLSDALNITITSTVADRAEKGAEAAAEALLQVRSDYFVASQQEQISYLQDRVARLQQVLTAASSEPLRINEVQSIRSALEVLSPRLAQTRRANGAAGTVLNVQDEAVARRPSPVYMPVLSGLMCGLLAGLALTRIREHRK